MSCVLVVLFMPFFIVLFMLFVPFYLCYFLFVPLLTWPITVYIVCTWLNSGNNVEYFCMFLIFFFELFVLYN